jgi:hypothetical protein
MKTIISYSIVLCCLLGITGGFVSCQKNNDVAPAPTISRVRTVSKDSVYTYQTPYNLDSMTTATRTVPVAFDSTTTLGKPGTMYAILGQNLSGTTAIYFNDVSVYFNPALVRDDVILVTIPTTTPYSGSNKLRVVTTGGSAEFGFSIQQPAPVITAVDQLAGIAGDVITLTGTTFDNVMSVTFGTAVAEITDKSPTQLKVKVPTGVTSTTLAVTTPGGRSAYAIPFGFKYVLFDDALIPGWTAAGYNGKPTVPSKAVVKRGTASMQYDYTGGYGGFQNFLGGTPINLTNYTGIKLSIYGGTGSDGKIIKMVLNGNYDAGKQLVLKAGVWQTFAVPLSTLGVTTGTLTEVTFQEFSGNVPETVYFDDLGLY